MPTWAAAAALACAAATLAGGITLIRCARPARGARASYYLAVAGGAAIAIVPLWPALFWCVQLLAVVLVIPYAIGLVGFTAWLRSQPRP